VFTAGTNGTLSIVTTDAAAAAANIQITADGTVDIDSAGVLTLDSGAAINIEPAAGSAILLDGTISVDAGVVTGATSITSTAFVGDITGDVTGTSDVATVATTVTITDNESTDEENAIIFTAGGDVDGGNIGLESDGTLTYNPSSGTLTTTAFAGALTTAAQTNITSLGTLTALTVDDVAINGKVITMTGSSSDTAVFTAGTNGTLSIVTTDAAAAAANIQITADGTVDIDSAGVLTLDSGAAINIEPAAGSAILLDGTISVDAGVVTGATSITSTAFVGDITGDVTGNTSGTAATVTTAAQTNITSLGTLTALTVDDVVINGKLVTMTGSTDDTAVFTVGTNGTLSIVTVDTAAAAANIQITADGTVDIDSAGVLTLDSGAAINIEPASGSAILLDGTISIDGGAITGVASILQADVKIGEDDQTKIDFETADEIHLYAANVEQVYLADNIFGPESDSDVDLGTTGVRWKDAFVDSITVTGEVDAVTLDISGNADIDGTTNLDAVDIDGNVQIDGTVTVGVDDTGKDVKFFGASAGAYLEWDESADQLRIMGASADATTSTGKLLLATSLTDINANDVIGKIDFQAPHEAGGTDAITVAASIQAIAQGTFSASVNATDLVFYTGHSEAATEKIRFTSQNEIGIAGANYGTDGQVLTSAGAGAAVAWEDAGGGGGGITVADQWRLTTTIDSTSADITANLEQIDQAGTGSLGSAMTQSSGVFTFPSTGYWLVRFIGDFDSIDNDTTAQVGIHLTQDNSAFTHVANAATGTKYGARQTASCEIIVDVADVSNDKVKFATSSLAGDLLGNTEINLTSFIFIRLGDT